MPGAGKVYLVGIGYRPLGARAHAVVRDAGILLASSRLLEVFTRYDEYEAVKDRITVIDSVPETIAFIREQLVRPALRTEPARQCPQRGHSAPVLLASGDPMFFGIGRRMLEEFGSDQVEVLPDLSSMQEAFARINVPWDDAFCISVHGGPDIARRRALPYEVKDIPWLLERHPKIAVLTDRVNDPSVIAQVLHSALRREPAHECSDRGRSAPVIHVCERIGYPDERIWSGTVEAAAAGTFAQPNVLIILRQTPGRGSAGIRFGLREAELRHRDGMITKDEVRAVSIHKLRLPERGVLWDIGAGSGSVAIEAARLAPGLAVVAVEQEAGQAERIRNNKVRHDARNLEIVHGAAPEALEGLAAPDRVFIGGSGGRLREIVELASRNMQAGIVVINAATLETLQEGIAALEHFGFAVEVSELSVSRSRAAGGKRLMSAMNPVFVVKGERG